MYVFGVLRSECIILNARCPQRSLFIRMSFLAWYSTLNSPMPVLNEAVTVHIIDWSTKDIITLWKCVIDGGSMTFYSPSHSPKYMIASYSVIQSNTLVSISVIGNLVNYLQADVQISYIIFDDGHMFIV